MEFDHFVLLRYYPILLEGLLTTVVAIAISLGIGIVLGLLACLGSLLGRGTAHHVARAYVHLFRATPELVLIFWVYFCLPPILDIRLSALASGVLALSVVTGAYLAEIFRAGVLAVPHGQVEAAHSLAIPGYYRWRHVILPQAVRRMMPAFVNYFTELLKHTTLLAGIGVTELTYQAYTLGAQTFRYLEFLTAIAIAYFLVIFPMSLYVRRTEVKLVERTGQ